MVFGTVVVGAVWLVGSDVRVGPTSVVEEFENSHHPKEAAIIAPRIKGIMVMIAVLTLGIAGNAAIFSLFKGSR